MLPVFLVLCLHFTATISPSVYNLVSSGTTETCADPTCRKDLYDGEYLYCNPDFVTFPKQQNVVTQQQCSDLCFQEPGCTAWTLYILGGGYGACNLFIPGRPDPLYNLQPSTNCTPGSGGTDITSGFYMLCPNCTTCNPTGNPPSCVVSGSTANCDSPLALSTIDPPTLVPLTAGTTGFISANVLTLSWIWPFVQTRTNPIITFLTNGGVLSNPLTTATGCPVSQYSQTPVVNCQSTITMNFPWNDANVAACGFYKSSSATAGQTGASDIYTGYISLAANETISAGRSTVTRSLENTFQIAISFQKYASVSSSISVAAAVNVTTAIIAQEFGTSSPGVGTVQFVMQVGYPFTLGLTNSGGPMDTINGISSTPTTSLTQVSATPATQSGGFSSVTYLLTITPTASMCTLNGVYQTSNTRFQLQCTPAAIASNQCPKILNSGVGITLAIASSSFCAQVTENVGVTLQMAPYSDSSFKNQNLAFLIQANGFIYFLISVLSSPQVSVSFLTVDQVAINCANLPNGGQVVLYDSINSNPALTTYGNTFQYGVSAFTLPSGVYTGFSIGSNPNWNVPLDTEDTCTVTAQVTVNYQGLSRKRAVLQAQSSTQGTASTKLTLLHQSSGSTFPSPIISILMLTIVILGVLF